MAITGYVPSEIAHRAHQWYEKNIRAQVEQDNQGKMLAIDVDSGDYALADDSLTALDQMKARNPNASVYVLRIGFPTAVQIGAGRRPKTA